MAVRSSAADEDSTARSHAGIHVTRLGVAPDGLADAIASCRRSALSTAADAYRLATGTSAPPRMAVLVQPLVDSRVAGVAFGADPLTGDRTVVLVEAVRGLGEPLVAGRVSPHRYRLQAGPGRRWSLRESVPGAQRFGLFASAGGVCERPLDDTGSLLSTDALERLADMVCRAGQTRSAPQDVEWAMDADGIVLLQSRPLTSGPAAGGTLWSRANFIEVLPEIPSPLLLSLWSEVQREMVTFYEKAGVPVRRWGEIAKVIRGRLYFNATLIERMNGHLGVPPAFGRLCLGYALPPGPDPYRVRWSVALRRWDVLLRLTASRFTLGPRLRRLLRGIDAYRCAIALADLRSEPDAVLGRHLDAGWSLMAEGMPLIFSAAGGLMGSLLALGALLRGRVSSIEGFIGRMTAPGAKTVNTEQGLDFLALARDAAADPRCRAWFAGSRADLSGWESALAGTAFPAAFRRFLDRYGHRGIYESEIARPRFREDPSYLLSILAEAVHRGDRPDPETLERGREREAREAWSEFLARLTPRERLLPWRSWSVRAVLAQVKRFQSLRERIRSDAFRALESIRLITEELARRWAARGWLERAEDIYRLTIGEIQEGTRAAAGAPAFRVRAATRRAETEQLTGEPAPGLLCETPSGDLRPVPPPPQETAGGMPDTHRGWQGLAVSGGRARGPAAVVRTLDDVSRMRPGAILVAPATDPAWSPLFALARGLAVEMGGLLSHGSILAREYALPAVVNVPGLCGAVRDGEWIEVDGWAGTVRRVPPEPEVDPPAMSIPRVSATPSERLAMPESRFL
jgi:pyruvate,water dikinase